MGVNLMWRWRGPALAVLAAAMLAACEGQSDDPGIAEEQMVEARSLPADAQVPVGSLPQTLPARSAVRFLSQASFGANDEEVAKLATLWRTGWLTQQVAMPVSATHWSKLRDAQAWWVTQAPAGTTRDIKDAPSSLFDNVIWASYLNDPDQLRKRMGHALSQILVTSVDGLSVTGRFNGLMGAAYLDVLEQHAFGNFRDLLEAVTLSPAMGYYLSMRGNVKTQSVNGVVTRTPDENYAREVMQLFTLGLYKLNLDGSVQLDASGQPLESYTQADVAGLARVFTGWDLDGNATTDPDGERYRKPMVLTAAKHETLPKVFLGVTIAANTDGRTSLKQALDTLFNHPNVGPFVARQLIQRLVTSNPSPEFVTRVASRFNDNGSGVRGDMLAVIDAILRDHDAMSPMNIVRPQATWGKLREPVLRYTQMARALHINAASGTVWGIGNLSDPATGLAQSPLRAPSVFNFYRPGYVPPQTALGAQGLVAPEFQITTDTSVAGYVNTMQRLITTQPTGVSFDLTKELALSTDPAALVARLDLMLANQALSAATRSDITNAVAALPAGTDKQKLTRVRTAVLMVVAAPEFIAQK